MTLQINIPEWLSDRRLSLKKPRVLSQRQIDLAPYWRPDEPFVGDITIAKGFGLTQGVVDRAMTTRKWQSSLPPLPFRRVVIGGSQRCVVPYAQLCDWLQKAVTASDGVFDAEQFAKRLCWAEANRRTAPHGLRGPIAALAYEQYRLRWPKESA